MKKMIKNENQIVIKIIKNNDKKIINNKKN